MLVNYTKLLCLIVLSMVPTLGALATTIDFERPTYDVGNLAGQDGWQQREGNATFVTILAQEGGSISGLGSASIIGGAGAAGGNVLSAYKNQVARLQADGTANFDINVRFLYRKTQSAGFGGLSISDNGLGESSAGVRVNATTIEALTAGGAYVNLGTYAVNDVVEFSLDIDVDKGIYQVSIRNDSTSETEFTLLSKTPLALRDPLAIDSVAIMVSGQLGQSVYDDIVIEQASPVTATLGDRVWEDLNSDGIQDCNSSDPIVGDAGDDGPECASAGVSDVPVKLYRGDQSGQCDVSRVIATQTTGTLPQDGISPGFYFFTQLDDGTPLPPGYYCVEWTLPAGFTCTIPTTDETSESGDVDSDGVSTTLPDGTEVCRTPEPVFVASRGDRVDLDLGLVAQSLACNVEVDKKCQVTLPATDDLVCSDKIVATTLRYIGPNDISDATVEVNPDKGTTVVYTQDLDSGTSVLAADSQGGFTIDARTGNKNELGTKTRIRINGAEEVIDTKCKTLYVAGEPAPLHDPKGATSSNWSVINFVDKDALNTIVQVPMPPEAQDNCVAILPPPASCETLGKPKSLTFQYSGGTCASDNMQGSKSTCQDVGVLPDTVQVALTKDAGKFQIDPVAGVTLNDTFTLSSIDGKNFPSEIKLALVEGSQTIQTLTIHTSCSVPLEAGDVYGGLKVSGFNGVFNEVGVTYTYDVRNLGSNALSGLVVEDSIFGELDSNLSLAPAGQIGDSASYTETTALSATTINTATVKDDAQLCGQDTTTVNVKPPAIPVAGKCDELKPIDALVLEYVDQGHGDITKVELYDGKFDPNDPAKNRFKTVDGPIADGDVETLDGFAGVGAPNDVDIRMTFADQSAATSRYDRSCTDGEMNDISDCGTLQGDGKDNESGLNSWLLRDLLGNGKRLGCPGSPYAQ